MRVIERLSQKTSTCAEERTVSFVAMCPLLPFSLTMCPLSHHVLSLLPCALSYHVYTLLPCVLLHHAFSLAHVPWRNATAGGCKELVFCVKARVRAARSRVASRAVAHAQRTVCVCTKRLGRQRRPVHVQAHLRSQKMQPWASSE